MKFYFEPNHAVIQSMVNKVTDKVNRFVVCQFDDKGELETNDDKIIFILQNKVTGCTWDEGKIVLPDEVKSILCDDEIRELAKEKGIKSWHTKSIKRLKEEMGV